NDAYVYNQSTLAAYIQQPLFTRSIKTIEKTNVPAHLLGDSAFPLSANLMKPYTIHPNMPQYQTRFNYRLSRTRNVVERAFGQLKNRFWLLHRKIECDIDNVANIIKTAVILHNFCADIRDNVEVEWDVSQPLYKKPNCTTITNNVTQIRQALATHFQNNPLH
ncbi:unnamed protein product, partial [Didymodactylos carnosus]